MKEEESVKIPKWKTKKKGLLEKEEIKRIKISHSVCLYYQITQTFDSYTNYSPAMEHTGLLPNDPQCYHQHCLPQGTKEAGVSGGSKVLNSIS